MIYCDIMQEREAMNKPDAWISTTIQSLKKASPTSLKISLRSVLKHFSPSVPQKKKK